MIDVDMTEFFETLDEILLILTCIYHKICEEEEE